MTNANFEMKQTSKSIKEENNDSKELVIESSLLDSILPRPPKVKRILPKNQSETADVEMTKVNSDSELKPAKFEMKYTNNSIKEENNDSKEFVIESSLLDSILRSE